MNENQPINAVVLEDDAVSIRPKRKRISAKNLGKNTWRFIKKHRTFFILLVIAIVLNFIIYLAVPVIDAGKTKFVNLNTDVRIELNQKVKLKFSDTSAVVVHFTNDTCPAEKQCFGPGTKAVEYSLTVNGKKYATGSSNPAVDSEYQISTISTDYETYSIIQIIKTDSVK